MRKTKEEAEQTRQKILESARRMFFKNGVAKTSLENVATEAGVTRGAIYWHFKDKTELFFALQKDICDPVDEAMQKIFDSSAKNPLDTIARAIQCFFKKMETDTRTKEMVSVMATKCEYVGEFEGVIHVLMQPERHFLHTLETFYQKAQEKNLLKEGMSPHFLARDTLIFVNGLVNHLSFREGEEWQPFVEKLIAMHIDFRRKGKSTVKR